MSEPTIQCAFRLPQSLVARIDAYAETLSELQPGMSASRADAVRVLLTRALDNEDRAAKPRKGGARPVRRGPRTTKK